MPGVRILENIRPSSHLQRFQKVWPQNGRASARLLGDSVAVVGWIPRYFEGADVPPGFLRDQWPRDAALLSTGNERPPQLFLDSPHTATECDEERGQRGFRRYLEGRQFRGAVALVRPVLYTGEQGRPVFLAFEALARGGFTDVRLGYFASLLSPVEIFDDGFTMRQGDISQTEDGAVVIRVMVKMKVGLGGQGYSVFKTRKWPPWASLMIEFKFDVRNQKAVVDYHGTGVPSQQRYLNWRIDSGYEIETGLTEAGFDGFLSSGACQNALPVRYSSEYPLKVSPMADELTIEQIESMRKKELL